MLKLLEIKHGNKTTYCFKKSEADLEQKDLTTSGRHSIGYSDIPKEQWDAIFKKKNERIKAECIGNPLQR